MRAAAAAAQAAKEEEREAERQRARDAALEKWVEREARGGLVIGDLTGRTGAPGGEEQRYPPVFGVRVEAPAEDDGDDMCLIGSADERLRAVALEQRTAAELAAVKQEVAALRDELGLDGGAAAPAEDAGDDMCLIGSAADPPSQS